MQELTITELDHISGAALSREASWTASIGVSAALIGVAVVATGPLAIAAIAGSYAASYVSTLYV
ncbi:hypothetical protein [Salinimonas sediminis]|uniref:Bacteriocin n=1 Tax=Salinimonas sediminis TaxID=2303538 RepID=A0A346NPI2_9ALTE|nr:hypothetical protein [Salinimonas sediminis]AXR07439.1 hypothetical protein D0Y50_14415 [Salinimonas sediminis]